MSSEVETSREFTRGLCRGIESLASRTPSAALQPRLRSKRRCEVALNMLQRIFITAFAVVAAAQFARADSPNVTAVLSNSETAVGKTVEIQIKVTGPGDTQAPEQIPAEGLEIYRTGEDASSEIKFGAGTMQVTRSVTYTYTVLPKSAGRFTIPPQTIRVGNNSLRTPALTLNVADAPGSSAGARQSRGQQSQSVSAGDLLFAELIVPKKVAYVGEIVPVQIRMGFDPRVRPRLIEPPEITGQGFTAQKLQQSGQTSETINGRPYDVVTYKTAIAAARAGKFEVGPVKAKAQVIVPRARSAPRSRTRSPFDLFDLDDPFSDPFFSNPFAQMGERREVDIKSEPVALEVKPLPPSAPPSFSGAMGKFVMTTDAKPKSVQVGDPITVTSAISGRGNFDRVNAPAIEDERGWHKYPPSSKFKQDDEVGISGTKTFETVLSPNEKKQAVPVLAFSYFDPAKEHYATLRSESIAITVQGGAPATQNITASQPTSASPAPAVAAQRTEKPQDILYQLTDRPAVADTFKLDTDSRDQLRRLFEQSDEWQYSGAHNGPATISPESRREVLELIKNLK